MACTPTGNTTSTIIVLATIAPYTRPPAACRTGPDGLELSGLGLLLEAGHQRGRDSNLRTTLITPCHAYLLGGAPLRARPLPDRRTRSRTARARTTGSCRQRARSTSGSSGSSCRGIGPFRARIWPAVRRITPELLGSLHHSAGAVRGIRVPEPFP